MRKKQCTWTAVVSAPAAPCQAMTRGRKDKTHTAYHGRGGIPQDIEVVRAGIRSEPLRHAGVFGCPCLLGKVSCLVETQSAKISRSAAW